MQRPRTKLLIAFALGLSSASPSKGNTRQTLARHWRETDSETLRTVRYNNCDYGYDVALPAGVVAHDTLPPSPNHGFLIALPEVGTTNYVLDGKKRFIWADASYNTTDADSASGLVAKRDIRPANRSQRQAVLAGLPAIRVTSTHRASAVVELTTVALQEGIIYTFGLQTNGANRAEDEAEYNRIIHGFGLLPLPRGQCSNG